MSGVLDSREQLRRVASHHEAVGDQRAAAATLHRLAVELSDAGLFDTCRDCFDRARSMFANLDERDELALVEMDFARAWSRSGDHAAALAYGEHALALRRELGNDAHLAAALDNLGLLHAAAGDRRTAIELIELSLPLAERCGDDAGLRTALCNLASMCEGGKLFERALDYYERALPLVERAGARDEIAAVLDSLGWLYWACNHLESAITFTTRALAMYEEDGVTDKVAELQARLEKIVGGHGDPSGDN